MNARQRRKWLRAERRATWKITITVGPCTDEPFRGWWTIAGMSTTPPIIIDDPVGGAK